MSRLIKVSRKAELWCWVVSCIGLGRFVPRHEDELELEADDPLLLEAQAEDLWCEAYNMRTGARGIFPAFYAVTVTKENTHPKGSGPFLFTSILNFNWIHVISHGDKLAEYSG